jgi:hypothetical protein
MANLRIVPRNFYQECTLTTEIDPAVGSAVVNTQNRKRSRVWRSVATTDQYIRGTINDFQTRTTDFFGLFRHHCHAGKVRLRLFSDSNWTTEVYNSGLVNVANIIGSDGHDSGHDPFGIGDNDPHITEAPFFLWHTPTGWQSFEIDFTDHTFGVDYGFDYWEVCSVMIGRSFEVDINPSYGAEVGFIDLTETDRSRGGSLYSNIGEQARTMRLPLEFLRENERAAILDIVRRAGLGRDVVVSLFPEDGTRLERDHTMYGVLSALNSIGRQANRLTHTLQFQEA